MEDENYTLPAEDVSLLHCFVTEVIVDTTDFFISENILEVQEENIPEVQEENIPEVQEENIPKVQEENIPEVQEENISEVQEENVSSEPVSKKLKKAPDHMVHQKNTRKLRGMKGFELLHILNNDLNKFCQDNGLIAKSVTCTCGKSMKLVLRRKTMWLWNCQCNRTKKTQYSIRNGSFFEKSRISIKDILWLAYMWLYEYSYDVALHESNHSFQTIYDWFCYCRDVCLPIMESKSEPLGGLQKVIEVFPCDTGEGGLKEDQWVFCAIEQGSAKSLLIIVHDKTSKSLVNLFDKYIVPESTVLTNLWGVFKNFTETDFNYLLIQKSITFYDTVSKTEVDNVLKMKKVASRPPAINRYTKYSYNIAFCVNIYRKSLSYSDDAYLTFLQDISKVYTPHTEYLGS